MKGSLIHIFLLALLSVDMSSCQKKKHNKLNNNRINDDTLVSITNWQQYGLKSNQQIEIGVLKQILESLALFQRGECPYGEGNCEYDTPISILSRLISDLIKNRNNKDSSNNGIPVNDEVREEGPSNNKVLPNNKVHTSNEVPSNNKILPNNKVHSSNKVPTNNEVLHNNKVHSSNEVSSNKDITKGSDTLSSKDVTSDNEAPSDKKVLNNNQVPSKNEENSDMAKGHKISKLMFTNDIGGRHTKKI